MFETLWNKVPWSNFSNFFLLFIFAYVLIRHIIPLLFNRSQEDAHKNLEALIRQKKVELTSLDNLPNSDLPPSKGPQFQSNDLLKFINEKFPQNLNFYTNLVSKVSWNQEILNDDFFTKFPYLPVFSLTLTDIKKNIMLGEFAHLHRGEYEKVLLLSWFDRFIDCLMMDRPLPKIPDQENLSLDLNLWRWSIMSLMLEDKSWQGAGFDNQTVFTQFRDEVFRTSNVAMILNKPKICWERIINRVHELEVFIPLHDQEIDRYKNKNLSNKERLLLLKRFHPDSGPWEIIVKEYRSQYEEYLNQNFSKLSSI